MALLVFSAFAEQDLDDIWSYIAEDNEPNASEVVRVLHAGRDILALF